MVGVWNIYADIFLIVVGVVMLAAFGLPLTLAPMHWARALRWNVSQTGNLAIFLGRSLGVMISILAIYAFKVSHIPAAMPFYFDLILWVVGGMLLLHIYGAIRKVQPITETIEIIVWIILGMLTLFFYP